MNASFETCLIDLVTHTHHTKAFWRAAWKSGDLLLGLSPPIPLYPIMFQFTLLAIIIYYKLSLYLLSWNTCKEWIELVSLFCTFFVVVLQSTTTLGTIVTHMYASSSPDPINFVKTSTHFCFELVVCLLLEEMYILLISHLIILQ